jgi:hypothetical protein
LRHFGKNTGMTLRSQACYPSSHPNNLAALATNSADCHLRPSSLEFALPLCEPSENEFVVLLLADAGENLRRGTVLEIEVGLLRDTQGLRPGWEPEHRFLDRWQSASVPPNTMIQMIEPSNWSIDTDTQQQEASSAHLHSFLCCLGSLSPECLRCLSDALGSANNHLRGWCSRPFGLILLA